MNLVESIKKVNEHDGAVAVMGNSAEAISEFTKDELSRLLFVADKHGTDYVSTSISLDMVLSDNTLIFLNASRAKVAVS